MKTYLIRMLSDNGEWVVIARGTDYKGLNKAFKLLKKVAFQNYSFVEANEGGME